MVSWLRLALAGESPVTASEVLRLQMCAPMPSLCNVSIVNTILVAVCLQSLCLMD